jgi:hypothetical protein
MEADGVFDFCGVDMILIDEATVNLVLEALENSVDLVREDAYQAEKLYGNYPTRQGKVNGLKVLADDHEKAITAMREALAAHPAPAHPDSYRINWLTKNPVDALDIFGQVKGVDAVRWIRDEIDNAIAIKENT